MRAKSAAANKSVSGGRTSVERLIKYNSLPLVEAPRDPLECRVALEAVHASIIEQTEWFRNGREDDRARVAHGDEAVNIAQVGRFLDVLAVEMQSAWRNPSAKTTKAIYFGMYPQRPSRRGTF